MKLNNPSVNLVDSSLYTREPNMSERKIDFMNSRIISDISDFIFVADTPKKVFRDKGIKIKTAMIICKAFHARRCLMLYQLAFTQVEFIVCPVHCFNITKENWFTTEQGIDRVLGELARCGNQFNGDIKEYLLK